MFVVIYINSTHTLTQHASLSSTIPTATNLVKSLPRRVELGLKEKHESHVFLTRT